MLRLAAYALNGLLPATLVVLGYAGLSLVLPIIGLFSSATVALIALRRGLGNSLQVLLAAGATLALLGLAITGSGVVALTYGALLWLPCWLLALILRETGALRSALEGGALLALIVVLGVYATVDEPAAMWVERLQSFFAQLSDRMPEDEIGRAQQISGWIAPYLTGMIAGGSAGSVFLSLFLARWWQACLFNPGGFGDEFTHLRYHRVAHYAAVALAVIGSAAGGLTAELAWNLLLVLSVLFIVLGLAIVHRMLAAKTNRRFWLAGLYLLAMFVPQTLLPVALLGVSDIWIDWRNRRLLG